MIARAIRNRLRRLTVEEGGQMTIDWALVMAAVALPFVVILRVCLAIIVAHFQMVTFLQSLPFP